MHSFSPKGATLPHWRNFSFLSRSSTPTSRLIFTFFFDEMRCSHFRQVEGVFDQKLFSRSVTLDQQASLRLNLLMFGHLIHETSQYCGGGCDLVHHSL